MRESIIYVHIESYANMVLSYGISEKSFVQGVKQLPNNILSLDYVDRTNEVDISTGFNVYLGQVNVRKYLNDIQIKNKKWIDFDDNRDLSTLAPKEIASLLYLGHAYTNIDSPFYYKLQNDFVYLTLPNGGVKVYYRNIKQFYRVLALDIDDKITRFYRNPRVLFGIRNRFSQFPLELMKKLAPIFKNGAVLDFSNMNTVNKYISVPVLAAPDSVYNIKWHEPTMLTQRSKHVANIIYMIDRHQWNLEITDRLSFEQGYL